MSVRKRVALTVLLAVQVGLTACTRKDHDPEKGALKEEATALKPVEPRAPLPKPAPDYLVPPTQYGERDFIRALLVDQDDLYFATLRDVFRVPLSGGAPVSLSKTPRVQGSEVRLWQSGERLLTQSTTESVFLASPKAGGPWTPFVEATPGKAGGHTDVATRILKGVDPEGKTRRTTLADFDGQNFHFALQNLGPQAEVLSSTILSVSLAGGPPKVVFNTPGEIDEVHRFGEKIVFKYTKLPSAEALAQYEQARAKEPYRPRPKGPSGVFVLIPGQGDPHLLMPLSHLGSSVIVVGDSSQVILTGFEEGNFKKGGLYRVALEGGAPQRIDTRALVGEGFVRDGEFVISGAGAAQDGSTDQGEAVLIVPRRRGNVRQVAFLVDGGVTQARALAGETLLLSRYDEANNRASVVKVSLKGAQPNSPEAQ